MRNIKFKAYIKDLKKVVDVREIDFAYKYIVFRLDDKAKDEKRTFDQIELIQNTGELDKNGNEIFESDILKINDNLYDYVIFNSGCFCMANAIMFCEFTYGVSHYEIAGNIFDNPELLGEQ